MDSLAKIAQVFSEMETVELLLQAKSEEQFTDIFAEQHAA
jgi:mannitol/fructose-specific phosphotransferase system IIA component (Ntr-type)